MKFVIHPQDKVIFHVNEREFEDYSEAYEFMRFYGDFNIKFEFWIEYREYKGEDYEKHS